MLVVYFDQRLGAEHSKRWSFWEIVIFSIFAAEKLKKARNLKQKTVFFKFAPERWSTVLFQKNELFFSKTRFYHTGR